MGIFSFLTGNGREAADPRPERRDRDAGVPANPADDLATSEPEPGAGISDFEPLAREAEPAQGEPASAREPLAPDWWRATPMGADVPAPSLGAAEPPPDLESGAWEFGSLLTPPPAPQGPALQVGPMDPQKTLELKPKIVDALSSVFDPEIPVNIYELGLIYEVVVDAEARVLIRMTLTSPACPSAQQLPAEVHYKVKAVPGVADAAVDVVWDPPWTKDMMSDAAKLSLGIW